jgi:hypothetical protein
MTFSPRGIQCDLGRAEAELILFYVTQEITRRPCALIVLSNQVLPIATTTHEIRRQAGEPACAEIEDPALGCRTYSMNTMDPSSIDPITMYSVTHAAKILNRSRLTFAICSTLVG